MNTAAGMTSTADERLTARRARLRAAVTRLSERARTTELVKFIVLPGALAVVGGFAVMLVGWYGAAHTFRPIEQIPYLISGGLVGLGLVVVGALLLATAVWTTQLERFELRTVQRQQEHAAALEGRLRDALATPPGDAHNARARPRTPKARTSS